MIIRAIGTSFLLITQPAHAALAARIVAAFTHLPDSPRRPSILRAIEHHDQGWAEADGDLLADPSGRLLDFMHASDEVKRETSTRGIDLLAADPYAAALVAQHRLHVYRRFAAHPGWRAFFIDVARARARFLDAAKETEDVLLHDYPYLRAGDQSSLAFCNGWADTEGDGCDYRFALAGTVLTISPDPFDGQEMPVVVEGRMIDRTTFDSLMEARRIVADAPVVTLRGTVIGRMC